MISKDFLRQILSEEKALLPLSEVKWVTVARYDELSVINLFPQMKSHTDLMRYFPDRLPKGRNPDRQYFFNILNSHYPEYTQELIKFASAQRFDAAARSEDDGVIKVSDAWWEKLNALPFLSSKCPSNTNPRSE